EKIAHEKCGIARRGKPLVCGAVSGRAGLAIAKECAHAGAGAVFVEDGVEVANLREKGSRYSFDAAYGGKKYSISLSAPGKFQVSNASCALAACALLGAGRKDIERGLTQAKPAYRLQKVGRAPAVVADCAHNPEAARALAYEVSRMRAGGKKVLLFSAMKDKDYAAVLGALAPLFDCVVIAEVALARGERLPKLRQAAKAAGARGILLEKMAKRALAKAKKLAGKGGLVVAAGSIYLLAELFGKDKRRLAQ
ncbi:MAG: cyanophycin synthetase, partial [Candidatus Micrarchaeia archaeon]